MNKNYIIIFFIFIVLILAIIYYSFQENSNQDIANQKQISDEIVQNISNDISANEEAYKQEHPTEIELSTFSTTLLDKAEGRLNNIKITCDLINGYVLKSGETFSFEDTIGPSTEEKGYQEASVIIDDKVEQALGGGNCQVSSTLYNAVNQISELEVIERHNHGKEVHYVELGSDAAVSYGSFDFKFKNNLPYDIKLYLSSDDENVYAKIVKLEY